MARLYANNASDTLNGAILLGDTTLTLNDASEFPSPTGSDYCIITINDGTNIEIIKYTGKSTNDLTGLTRAQESTTAVGFADAVAVEVMATADSYAKPWEMGIYDLSSDYISFGGSSTSTAYNLQSVGAVPQLTGPLNYHFSFTSTSLYLQAGTSWNSINFSNDSTKFVLKTNNVERLGITDSGTRLGGSGARVTTILDEDAMGTDSATALATQQSIKAYVDAISETGTFTPTLFESGSEVGDATYNASFTTGSYIKINGKVWVSFSFRLTSKGTVTGSNRVQIGDLPFTSNSSVGLGRGAITFYVHNGVSATNTGTLMSLISSSTNYVDIKILDPASDTTEAINFDDITSSLYCQFTGYYAT